MTRSGVFTAPVSLEWSPNRQLEPTAQRDPGRRGSVAGVMPKPGQTQAFVVRKGVRHNPVADAECYVMLSERKSTLHSGSEVTERTRTLEEQLRPL